jgi:hypothetical protein
MRITFAERRGRGAARAGAAARSPTPVARDGGRGVEDGVFLYGSMGFMGFVGL